MLLRQMLLGFLGLCAGGVIAAGIYAFLVVIGVFPRLMGRTNTGARARFYETVIVAGGVLGNVSDLYEIPIRLGSVAGQTLLTLCGLFAGIFAGCLVMSLAETLKALPVVTRRVHLARGIQYVVLGFGLGKLVGSLLYFWMQRR